MSNGGGENGRQLEQRNFGGDDFAQAIAKIAVAQVCEIEGFQSFQQLALETLSDVVVRYILNVGKCAHYHANLSGRDECNVLDVIQGLEDMGSIQGFAGASDVDHCLGSSGVVRDIVEFASEAEQVPFVYPIPKFPLMKERLLAPSFLQIGEKPPREHIPAWLPAFRNPQTYVQQATWNGRRTEAHAVNFERERVRGKGEQSLLNLQKYLASNGFEKSTLIDPADVKAKRVAAEGNTFLAAPLQIWDKEVASVVPPFKIFNGAASPNPVVKDLAEDKSVSVVETFAPAIEAIKNTQCDFREGQTELLLNKKPTVHFKIGIRNKLLGRLVDLSPSKKDHKKTLLWFAMEDEKDDRKRRAEKILRESLENPDELVQL